MKKAYMLSHKIKISDNEDNYETKLIGFYSDITKANITIKKYQSIKGFVEYPNNFIIEEYIIDFDDFDFE